MIKSHSTHRIINTINDAIEQGQYKSLDALAEHARLIAGLTNNRSGFFGVSFVQLLPVLDQMQAEQNKS